MKLTVITSVFNSEFFLDSFFEDILKQTVFQDCEFFFLDANSKDASREKILKLVSEYNNIQYFNVGNKNIYETWNIGVVLSKTQFLTNWNTDDRRFADSLEKQINFLETNPDIDLCYGETLWVDTPNIEAEKCNQLNKTPCFDATIETMLQFNSPHCLPLWRKDLHKKYGLFNDKYFSAGDYEMWMRALSNGSKFGKLKDTVGSYYRNPKGISSNPENLDRAVGEVMKIRDMYTNKMK